MSNVMYGNKMFQTTNQIVLHAVQMSGKHLVCIEMYSIVASFKCSVSGWGMMGPSFVVAGAGCWCFIRFPMLPHLEVSTVMGFLKDNPMNMDDYYD